MNRMNCRLEMIMGGAAFALVAPFAAGAADTPWRDTPATRLEALALLETLNADLLSNDSATLTLDRWCEVHKMATPAKVVAERVHGDDKVPTQEARQLLGVGPDDPIRYRH